MNARAFLVGMSSLLLTGCALVDVAAPSAWTARTWNLVLLRALVDQETTRLDLPVRVEDDSGRLTTVRQATRPELLAADDEAIVTLPGSPDGSLLLTWAGRDCQGLTRLTVSADARTIDVNALVTSTWCDRFGTTTTRGVVLTFEPALDPGTIAVAVGETVVGAGPPNTTGITFAPARAGGRLMSRDAPSDATFVPWRNGFLMIGTRHNGSTTGLMASADGVSWGDVWDGRGTFANSLMEQVVRVPGVGPDQLLGVGVALGVPDPACAHLDSRQCPGVDPVRFWTSSDGLTWFRADQRGARRIGRAFVDQLVAGPNEVLLTATSFDPDGTWWQAVWRSSDGVDWTAAPAFHDTYPDSEISAIAWLGDRFIATGSSGGEATVSATWTSSDGLDWTSGPTLGTRGGRNAIRVGRPGALTQTDPDPHGSQALWSTSDGSDWRQLRPEDLPFVTTREPLAFGSNGRRIVALGMAWDGHQGIWVSNDGATWEEIEPSGGLPILTGQEDVLVGVGRRGLAVAIDQTLWYGAWPTDAEPDPTPPAGPAVASF